MKCDICSHKLQKRACGLVCKNWKCPKFWKYGKTLRSRGFIGKISVGDQDWEFTPTEIKKVEDDED